MFHGLKENCWSSDNFILALLRCSFVFFESKLNIWLVGFFIDLEQSKGVFWVKFDCATHRIGIHKIPQPLFELFWRTHFGACLQSWWFLVDYWNLLHSCYRLVLYSFWLFFRLHLLLLILPFVVLLSLLLLLLRLLLFFIIIILLLILLLLILFLKLLFFLFLLLFLHVLLFILLYSVPFSIRFCLYCFCLLSWNSFILIRIRFFMVILPVDWLSSLLLIDVPRILYLISPSLVCTLSWRVTISIMILSRLTNCISLLIHRSNVVLIISPWLPPRILLIGDICIKSLWLIWLVALHHSYCVNQPLNLLISNEIISIEVRRRCWVRNYLSLIVLWTRRLRHWLSWPLKMWLLIRLLWLNIWLLSLILISLLIVLHRLINGLPLHEILFWLLLRVGWLSWLWLMLCTLSISYCFLLFSPVLKL